MKNLFLLFTLISLISCKNQTSETAAAEEEMPVEAAVSEEAMPEETSTQDNYDPATNDDQMGANIKNFLVNDFLKDDMAGLSENDHKFQFYKIDINNDGKDEYFVRFMSSYFCGTGGCTILLLDHESNIITKFTVMDPPIFVEKGTQGWGTILVRSGGELKELKFNNGKYPSNPSVLPKAPYDAPSGFENVYILNNLVTLIP